MPPKSRMKRRTNMWLDENAIEDIEFLEFLYNQPAAEVIRRAVKRIARKERINNPSMFDAFMAGKSQPK